MSLIRGMGIFCLFISTIALAQPEPISESCRSSLVPFGEAEINGAIEKMEYYISNFHPFGIERTEKSAQAYLTKIAANLKNAKEQWDLYRELIEAAFVIEDYADPEWAKSTMEEDDSFSSKGLGAIVVGTSYLFGPPALVAIIFQNYVHLPFHLLPALPPSDLLLPISVTSFITVFSSPFAFHRKGPVRKKLSELATLVNDVFSHVNIPRLHRRKKMLKFFQKQVEKERPDLFKNPSDFKRTFKNFFSVIERMG